MKVNTAEFVKSAVLPKDYPESPLPEFAFAGRSNVGKSSLMNTMMRRKRLVKVSSTPGRTQLLNWFEVNEKVMLCDLPGYGFAKVPDSVRRQWGPMVGNYLQSRENLIGVVLIVDVRRGFQDDDMQLLRTVGELGILPILVATKCDKLKRNALNTQKRKIVKALRTKASDVVWFSSETGDGRDDLWRRMRAMAGL